MTFCDSISIPIQRIGVGEGLDLPAYQTPQSAGMDLLAAINEDVVLKPNARALVPTGIAIALPDGFEAQIRPRSGLAYKQGLTVLNAPGTIDADYRGEIGVLLINLGDASVTITRAMRIAQMVIAPVVQGRWWPASDLSDSQRGFGGFGSTGS